MPAGMAAVLLPLLLGVGPAAGAFAPRTLALRGGFDPLRAVSAPRGAGADTDVDLSAPLRRDPMDRSLFEGDVQRMFEGGVVDPQEAAALDAQFGKVADDVLLTQQFLVLQNIRIEDQLPGGANCSYAETWYTGALWEKHDDEFQWTRAAWLQFQRAKTWQETPAVYKRIMRNAWEDLQDFLAMLALPDGGRYTERYREHEAAWALVRAAYLSNVNRQVEALAKGDMAAEVEERREAAQPYVEAKCSDPQVCVCAHPRPPACSHVAHLARSLPRFLSRALFRSLPCSRAHMHTHTQTHTRARAHTHTHTHTHTIGLSRDTTGEATGGSDEIN